MSGKVTAIERTLKTWLLLQVKDLNVNVHSLIAAEGSIALTVRIVEILVCAGEPPNLIVLLSQLLSFLVDC
jgi:hypothetical protein